MQLTLTDIKRKDSVCARLPSSQPATLRHTTVIHRRALRQAAWLGLPFQKVGVWEDTRMLKFPSGGCASKAGLGGANHAQIRCNFAQSDCKSYQAPTPKSVKRRGLGGYADAKLPAGDCASGLGLVHANHVLIQYNFARVTDIATVLKSLLDSSIPRQFSSPCLICSICSTVFKSLLDMLDMLDSFQSSPCSICSTVFKSLLDMLDSFQVPA